MPGVTNRTRTPGYIPNALYEIIRKEYEETGMPMARIVERLIKKGIEVEQKEKARN